MEEQPASENKEMSQMVVTEEALKVTRINRMVMQGFKSFAKHTEILFGGNFNCVLGPNGAGKSNVLDALCFVLGKSSSRELRAEKSANLIYNGGKAKKPAYVTPFKKKRHAPHFQARQSSYRLMFVNSTTAPASSSQSSARQAMARTPQYSRLSGIHFLSGGLPGEIF